MLVFLHSIIISIELLDKVVNFDEMCLFFSDNNSFRSLFFRCELCHIGV